MTIEFTMDYKTPDGVTHKKGEVADLPDDQARVIVNAGAAREAGKGGLKDQR